MSELVVGQQAGARSARSHALSVLHVRSTALAVALLPAAAAVILFAGEMTGSVGAGWDGARTAVTAVAVPVLLVAVGVMAVIARARPALSPTVTVEEHAAPDLYGLVRDLADRLDVPAPSAIALTPDCDSWLEDRTHRAHAVHAAQASREARERGWVVAPDDSDEGGGGGSAAPVLVIGSPFLWWMRVAELRALLAPVVAGTGPSAHPDIAAARRFVRGLDAAVAVADRARESRPSRLAADGADGVAGAGEGVVGAPAVRRMRGGHVRRWCLRFVGACARLMLRAGGPHAAEMERGVAAAAAGRAQGVDHGPRIAAQAQVGLAYAGWDRLLTRVALPAWRIGRWPSRLNVGVVSALTELSRRDRLAEGFAARLSERPACDLLEEPGAVDEAISLLAARLFHGGPQRPGPDWAPVDWQAYPEEVVDRIWRTYASRLFTTLDAMDRSAPAGGSGVVDDGDACVAAGDVRLSVEGAVGAMGQRACGDGLCRPTLTRVMERFVSRADGGAGDGAGAGDGSGSDNDSDNCAGDSDDSGGDRAEAEGGHQKGEPREETDVLAARIGASVAREQAAQAERSASAMAASGGDTGTGTGTSMEPAPMGLPLQPARSGRELLAEHLVAAVCCAAVDTAGAAPGLDWLDGPVLRLGGRRAEDLMGPVLDLIESGDERPLRAWLTSVGVRPDKPLRLV